MAEENEKTTVSVIVTQQFLSKVKAEAARDDRTLSGMLRVLLSEAMENRERARV